MQMMGREDVMARIVDLGLVAVIRLHDSNYLDLVVEALGSAGARIIEITMTVPGAIEIISNFTEVFGEDFIFGCGTVMDAVTARRAIDAGAGFVVSPVLQEEVVETAASQNIVSIPAAMSPTEAWRASMIGADAIKLFPARVLGPRFVSDILAPLPNLRIIPSGGIDPENAGSFVEAGAIAVFSGSSLVNDDLVLGEHFAEIEGKAKEMILNISHVKGMTK